MNKIERSVAQIESDLLRTFLCVAEQQNLTRAAERLGRTQSAISVQIKKLETSLSVALFNREPRGMSLTEEGEALLSATRPILRDLDRLGAIFTGPLSGRIRVGVPDDYGTGVIESILSSFCSRHPGVEVEIHCAFSVAFPSAIERGDLDLAVYTCDPTERLAPPLLTEESVWVAKHDWQPQKSTPVPLALFDRACWWREAAIEALRKAGIAYRIAVTSESAAGVKAAIASGLAIGMLARYTVEPGLKILRARDGFPVLPPSVLSLLRNENAHGETVDAMAAALRDGFRGAAGKPRGAKSLPVSFESPK